MAENRVEPILQFFQYATTCQRMRDNMAENRVEPILQFFQYAHLKPELAAISAEFANVAHTIVAKLPRNPERTVALRKLLEAKDAAVRAWLYKEEE
jgi:hypothetical protein